MEVSKKVIVTTLIPRIPGIILTFILNKLSLSAACDKQDARVEVAVYVVRAFTALRRSTQLVQEKSMKDPGIRGKLWISKVAAPAGATHLRDAVVQGVKILGTGNETYILPDIQDVEAEWTGYRGHASKNSPRPAGSEHDQYRGMMAEVTSDVTVLFFHGGGYFMMDPATYRGITYSLAKRTGGRCLSVRYRLAPRYPFPAALLDALTSYMYLVAPPEGSFHEPVPPENIVFAGDSAGGNLATALALLLVTLRNSGVTSISYGGRDVPLEMPAGVALISPWCDIGRGLPSIWSNAKYDYLHPPGTKGVLDVPLPRDEIWPASPPRAEMYCSASLLTHPLVSPVVATAEMWTGMPPVFIAGGNETLQDEFTVLARNMYLSGAPVVFKGYEGMPHCFAMVVMDTPIANHCLDEWARFCVDAVNKVVERKDTATWWKARTSPFQFYDVGMADMGLEDRVVRDTLGAVRDRAMEREQDEIRQWKAAES